VIAALVTIQWPTTRDGAERGLSSAAKEYIEAARCLALPPCASSSGTCCRLPAAAHRRPRRWQVAGRSASRPRSRSSASAWPITEPSLGLLIANGYQYCCPQVLDQLLSRIRC